MFRAIVNDDFNNHSAATSRRSAGRIDLETFNCTPLAARAPIAVKLFVRILRGVFVLVLLPLRIVEPQPVSRFKLS